MNKVGLSAPWETYVKEVKALFEFDPDFVGMDWDEENYDITLKFSSRKKVDALQKLLPSTKDMGNIHMKINIVLESEVKSTSLDLFDVAFEGNPVYSFSDVERLPAGDIKQFVLFKPEATSFFNDDISRYQGYVTKLYEEIARDVFDNISDVAFNSDINAND